MPISKCVCQTKNALSAQKIRPLFLTPTQIMCTNYELSLFNIYQLVILYVGFVYGTNLSISQINILDREMCFDKISNLVSDILLFH
jgi:hypothetical protein